MHANLEQMSFKKKRQENSIHIRRNIRQQIFTKRRNLNDSCFINQDQNKFNIGGDQDNIIDLRVELNLFEAYKQVHERHDKNEFIISDIIQKVTKLMNNPVFSEMQLSTLIQMHKSVYQLRLLLDSKVPVLQLLQQKQLLRSLTPLLLQNQYPQLQFQYLFIIANITYHSSYSYYEQIFKELKIIPYSLKMLTSSEKTIREECIGILGNLSCENVQVRDYLIEEGAIRTIVQLISQGKDIEFGAWALSNFCRGNPKPKFQDHNTAIMTIIRLVSNNVIRDAQTLGDCLNAIAQNINGSVFLIQQLISSGIICRLGPFLTHKSFQVILPALQIVSTIVTGSSNQVSRMIKDPLFLDCLAETLKNTKHGIRNQACWVLQNLLSTQRHIELVIKNKKIMDMITYMYKTGSPDIKIQVYIILGNIAAQGCQQWAYEYIKSLDFVEQCLQDLRINQTNLTKTILQNLIDIITLSENFSQDQGQTMMQELNYKGFEKILHQLQGSMDQQVAGIVQQILYKFYSNDDY